jgi:hypothetical protein
MKAILKFNLPEDALQYRHAFHAEDLAIALWEVSQYLRGVDKYNTGDDIEKIRENFYDILNSYDINLDNLIE